MMTKSLQFARLNQVISRFPKASVLVVGDLILDEYIWGSVSRISPEAPVPVVWVNSESFVPGGASNVANNIRSLGGRVYLMGVVGQDANGRSLLELLRKNGIQTQDIWKSNEVPTTLKTRVVAHHQQVVRIDRERIVPLPKEAYRFFLKQLEARIRDVDAVCIEDYGKGVITPELVQAVVKLAKRRRRIITVDPKEDHMAYYRGTTAITPNHHEASVLSKVKIHDDASLKKAGEKLMKKLACENVLITQGENGMSLFQKGKKLVKIPTVAQDVFDVSGAGDTVISTFTLARASKANPLEAAYLANCAGGIVVGKVGTACVTQDELRNRTKELMGMLS